MSFVQLVSAFRLYNADVLLLALGVTLLTSLLKKTVMKSFDRKFFTLLPFGIGLALYAAWRMATTGSFRPLWELQTLEGGFGCGCAATLYYVVYEQFFRGKFSRRRCAGRRPRSSMRAPAAKRRRRWQSTSNRCSRPIRRHPCLKRSSRKSRYCSQSSSLPSKKSDRFFPFGKFSRRGFLLEKESPARGAGEEK